MNYLRHPMGCLFFIKNNKKIIKGSKGTSGYLKYIRFTGQTGNENILKSFYCFFLVRIYVLPYNGIQCIKYVSIYNECKRKLLYNKHICIQ